MNPCQRVPVTPHHPTPTGTAEADLLVLELSDPSSGARDVVDARQGRIVGGHNTSRPNETFDPAALISDLPRVDDPLGCGGTELAGSAGEHLLQATYGTSSRALRFYADQVLDRLNPKMIEFTGRMEMAFIATADAGGECDCSLRAGPPGFIRVLDERTLAYPEYRGNGVLASLGNITENAQIGVLLLDFVTDLIGLHVNGTASIVDDDVFRATYPDTPVDEERGRTPERWVVVRVTEAYIHCRKHIPRMVPAARSRSWGSDDALPKGGDYFGVRAAAKQPVPQGAR